MKRPAFFESHLYSQIVLPLLAASISVALIASFVAVYFLRDLTGKWVSQVAEATTVSVADRYRQYAADMQGIARLAAENSAIQDAASRGDDVALQAELSHENLATEYDSVSVLDAGGRVVATDGQDASPLGSTPIEADEISEAATSPATFFARVGGQDTVTALHPIGSNYTLALSKSIDDSFLAGLAGSAGAAFCIYDGNGRQVACNVSSSEPEGQRAALREALMAPSRPVKTAIDSSSAGKPGVAFMTVANENYEVWARKIVLPSGQGTESFGYLVGTVSQHVSDQAGRTTTNLIVMWSIVAVVSLVGLGGWVARRVSDPLVDLAEGARRIADGDFSTKVHVAGENEIAVLAETFNDMTDSLKERSETLTKKVLELATLYEMSRALGSTLDMDELLGSVLDSALRIFDLDLGYVALRDKDTGGLSIRAVRGGDRGAGEAVRSSMSEWVVREGRPLIFNPDPAAEEGQIDTLTGAKAALCVPLVSAEGTIGSITVGSSDAAYRFNSDDVRLLSTIGNHVTIAIGNIELFTSLQEAYLATVRSLAAAVDAKDTYTRGHSDRVAAYATLIAERLELSHEQRIALEMAAYLHDIGKIGVKEEILLKPGRLTDEEMGQMRHHPLIGANILKPVAFPWAITPIVRHHHEHYDGSGYPAGLKGEEIPLLARVLTAADSYEAMTADRPYRAGRSATEAIEEMRRCSGTQFDPRIVEILTAVVEELERTGDGLVTESPAEIAPEEARAIFAALVDGVLASFRRLGGPRLAANVEAELDAYLEQEETPFRITRGRMAFAEQAPVSLDGELDQMRASLRRMDAIMGRVSGGTLVDHFYSDALDGFSARMRHLTIVLGFYGPN